VLRRSGPIRWVTPPGSRLPEVTADLASSTTSKGYVKKSFVVAGWCCLAAPHLINAEGLCRRSGRLCEIATSRPTIRQEQDEEGP
jgi:hypothetical protein